MIACYMNHTVPYHTHLCLLYLPIPACGCMPKCTQTLGMESFQGSITREASTPVPHSYAEIHTTPEHKLIRQSHIHQAHMSHPHHHHAGTPIMNKSPFAAYTTMPCHPALSNIFASPPATPSPIATPIKILAQPQHLLATGPMMTHDHYDIQDELMGTPMTPPVTPQSKLTC